MAVRESALQKARQKRSTTAIPVPEIQQYGVFTPGYSGYLQNAASDRSAGSSSAERFGNIAALKYNSDAEQMAYQNMLKRAQDLQIDAQKRDIRSQNISDIQEGSLDAMKFGVGGYAREVTDPTGESTIEYDPEKMNFGNILGGNQQISDYFKQNTDAIGSMIDRGYGPSNEAIGLMLRDPITGKPMPIGPRIKPADEINAAEVETAAQKLARETAVEQLKADNKDNDVQFKYVLDETGTQMLLEITGGNFEAVETAKQRARGSGVKVAGDPPPATASPNAGAQSGGASATPAAEIPPGDLTDYRDPGYDAIENRLERKYNLPPGLMKRVRVYGERSNANRVSPTGARTVYQILPSTRKLFGDKYKIDAYAGPAEAAEIAALHLKESIDRGEDPVLGYNAGPKSGGKWNSKEAREYKARVDGPEALASVRAQPGNDDVRIAKWKSIPQVADAQKQSDGSVVVTMKNGRTVRYVNGRRQEG